MAVDDSIRARPGLIKVGNPQKLLTDLRKRMITRRQK